jgi:RsiW-degrading membrane proteinase PrsW (M82 family)
LSLDAVIKYFSSGFVLCTFIVIVYEMMVLLVLEFFMLLILVCGINGEVSPGMAKQEIKDLTKQFEKDHVGIFVVYVFLNAFLVAAVGEEMSKYFGFWMLEHPDLMDAKDIVFLTEDGQEINTNNRTLQSRGAAITIAMVAVATGFACAENLLYVFVYTPPSVTNELVTLVTRSLFPLHPLLAAIQSIGVVQRDLESDRKSQLGRIVFPAVLLHGSFDFMLMISALLKNFNQPTATSGTHSNTHGKDDKKSLDDGIPMAISIGFMVTGFYYYYCASKSQRQRLIELDQGNQGGSETLV